MRLVDESLLKASLLKAQIELAKPDSRFSYLRLRSLDQSEKFAHSRFSTRLELNENLFLEAP